jgi:hypothetical protein
MESSNTPRGNEPFINDTRPFNVSSGDGVSSDVDAGYVGDGVDRDFGSHVQYERDSWRIMAEKLYYDMSALWSKERELIRTEMDEKMTQVKGAAGAMAVGGVLLFVGVFSLVATIMILLTFFVPIWVSAVIVTATLLIAGTVLVLGGKKKLEPEDLKPKHSVEALGEITSTLKERIYEFKRH